MKKIDFNKFTKEEQNRIEESVYAMMVQFKYTPLELDGQLPKELSQIVEDKWYFCLRMEKEMRESTLASILPDLTKEHIIKAVKRHNKSLHLSIGSSLYFRIK